MKYLILFFIANSLALSVNCQLVINEFMASNSTTLADNTGEYDDWIEIYNAGNESLDLGQYYLTDDLSNPSKFDLQELPDIPAHGYLIIFADEDGSQGYDHANFKLDREGEVLAIVRISGSDTAFVDSLSYGSQLTDISYGRYPDASSNLEYFTQPTPGSSNISDNYLGIAPPADFSITGGFYQGTQHVELSTSLTDSEIRYTLDGSAPDDNDPLYTEPLFMDKTAVLKARVFADDYLPGPTTGHSYFIDEHFIDFDIADRMSVVSVSLDPELAWGEESGIFYEDNLWNEWEYAANIELFEPDGTTAFNQQAGIKLFGNSTRRMAQKSFAVIARNEYGSNRFAYKIFDDIPFDEYKSFILRNGGNDWSQTYFRDALCQELIRNDMDIDAQGNRQAVVFINGDFYGIMNIKEKINEHYLEAHHGIDPDNFDMLQDEGEVVYGDDEEYARFRGFAALNDMSNDILFGDLETQMDIREYMNLYIAQIYISNIDMALNQKYWRERVNYGKWRWTIYDTEMSFGQGDYSYTPLYGTIPSFNMLDFATIDYGGPGWPHFQPWFSEKFISMLANEDFRDNFIQSFAVYLNTSFSTRRVLRVIDSLAHRARMEMPWQIEKYGGVLVGFNPYGFHFTTMEEWEFHVDTLHNFANLRPSYMRNFIQNRFNLEGTYTLSVTMADPAYGSVFIQDIKIPVDSLGIYFDQVPLHVRIQPHAGYRFVRWNGVDMNNPYAPEITLVLNEDATLEAVFEPEKDIMITEILYRPASGSEAEFIELYNPKHSTTIDLTGYSVTGDINFTFPAGCRLKPMSYLIVAADSTVYPSALNVYQWNNGSLDDNNGILMLWDEQGGLLDSVNYQDVTPWPAPQDDESIELIAYTLDNTLGIHWESGVKGGTAGRPAFNDQLQYLVINEVQSFNEDYVADEYKQYNDWIEILNSGTESVDIGGLYITNRLDSPGLYQIPTNTPTHTTLGPGEHRIIWADRDTGQGPLHLSFNLNKGGCVVGISADGKTFIDHTDTIVMIDPNLSAGRYPDGNGTWRIFDSPTPGKLNSLPPEFISEPLLVVDKRTQYDYTIEVYDPEDDALIVGVFVLPGWLTFLPDEDPPLLSGRSPISRFEPQKVVMFVTDGFTRPVTQEFEISQLVPDLFLSTLEPGQVTVYPNPTSDRIHILSRSAGSPIQLSIINLSGQVIWNETVHNPEGGLNIQVDLSTFRMGIYLLRIQSGDEVSVRKIVLQ